jgi:hypothetical protein
MADTPETVARQLYEFFASVERKVSGIGALGAPVVFDRLRRMFGRAFTKGTLRPCWFHQKDDGPFVACDLE